MKSIFFISMCLAACSTSKGTVEDAGYDATVPDGAPCVVQSDCPSAVYHCAYAIADGCSATHGICIAAQGPPYCDALLANCGCNGTIVHGNGDCFLPSGYTTGPSAGAPLATCGEDASTTD